MTQSETTLVEEARAGDQAAIDALIAAHLPLIYNIVGRALDGHADVDDLVQETMLRAIRGLPELREPDRFRSWLVAIAYRQIQLHLRARRTAPVAPMPETLEVPDPAGDFAERATAEMILADQRRELVDASHWLDDEDRRLLGLWWREAAGELTRAELAAELRVRPKHAAVRVQRMKAHLDAARGVVRALAARPRCPELYWTGVVDPLWRKRLVRHVRDCPRCAPLGHGLIAPEELLLGVATPAALLVGTGTPSVLSLLHHKTVAVAAAASVAVGGGLVYAVQYSPAPPPPIAAAPPPAVVRPSAPGAVARTPEATVSPTARPITQLIVAPGGSDSGDGSVQRPFASLAAAIAAVRPGQTIALRGGTHRPASALEITTSGTASDRITLSNYRDERPVLDLSGIPADRWAITQRAAFWTVRGLEVTGARSQAWVCVACRDTVFERLTVHGNARSGLMLRDAQTSGNRVLDSDFFANDTGLSVQFGAGPGNLVRGNRLYRNTAAGLDLGDFRDAVAVEYNWSFRNGGNGFVLNGGGAHPLRHNAAWSNEGHGFTDDGGGTARIALTNNTAYANGRTGFAFPAAPVILRSNAALANASPVGVSPAAEQSRNLWEAEFRSVDPTAAEGPRPAPGRLPRTDFLVTGNGVGASMGG